MPVADTCLLIDAAQGQEPAVRALRQATEDGLVLPFQVVIEFLAGVADREASLASLRRMAPMAPLDEAHLLMAAQIRQEVRAKRPRARWGDIHVATVARLRGDVVITANTSDFEGLGVEVRDYRA